MTDFQIIITGDLVASGILTLSGSGSTSQQ